MTTATATTSRNSTVRQDATGQTTATPATDVARQPKLHSSPAAQPDTLESKERSNGPARSALFAFDLLIFGELVGLAFRAAIAGIAFLASLIP